jgi:transposase
MAIRRKPTAERRDRQALEERRLHAAELFAQDVHQAEVARTLGVSRQTVSRWHQRWQADGTAGLQSRGAPGRAPQVSDAQLEQAEQALLKGAKAHGFDTDLWTLDRIAEVIWRLTGCVTTPPMCGGCCAIAWTGACNAPPVAPKSATSRRSASGSPATGPGSKKRQAPQGRHLLLRRVRRFADPIVRSTWAPRGKTPVLVHRFNWKRASIAAALCFGSTGGGCQLAFHVQPGSYNTDSLIGVLGELRRFLGGQKATVLWDGLPAHRSNKLRAFIASQRHWLVVERLPGYAPELNPTEALWGNLKGKGGELAYLAGDTLEEIIGAAQRGIDRVRRTPHLPYSFLRHSGLDLW